MKRRKNLNKHNLESKKKNLIGRALKFTETVVVWVTLIYFLNWVVSVVLITFAIKCTQNFAYLDILITETSETFRSIVGVSITKFGIENIFKYNDFGGKIPNKDTKDHNKIETDISDNEGGAKG